MARQIGVIKLKGILDDIVFFKSADGYIARMNTPITADRIATDPAYARTRENMSEFGRAGKGAKLLRQALRTELQKVSDGHANSRLVKEMMRVIHADAVSPRGLRNLVDGEKTLLEGFEFNSNAKVGSTFFAPYTADINRATGECTVTVPAFTPANAVESPAGATHFRLNTAAVAVDFETGTYQYAGAGSTTLALDGKETTAQSLVSTLAPNSTGTLLLVVGVEFFQAVNGANYSLNNGAFNALAIVKVD